MATRLSGIPNSYQGWLVPVVMDGAGKLYVGQTGKVNGVTNWGFSVWVKSGIDSADATRVLTLPEGSNGTLSVLGSELYVVEIKKGGGIWLTKIEGYVPISAPTPSPTPPTPPSDGVTISRTVAEALQSELDEQL